MPPSKYALRLLLLPLSGLLLSWSTAAFSNAWTFVERPETEVLGQGNVELVSVLHDDGMPFEGTTFTVLREEPVAFGPPRYRTLANTGPAARARFTLAPGRYRVLVRNGAVERTHDIRVPETGLLKQAVTLNAGHLQVSSVLAADSDTEAATWFRVLAPVNDPFGRPQWVEVAGNGYADSAEFLLPAGRYRVEARYGSAVSDASIEVVAGESTSKTLNLDAASITLSAVLAEEQDPVDGVTFRVLAADVGAEITRAETTGQVSFVLPAGDYTVQAQVDGITRDYALALEAGDDVTQILVLEAAEWRVSATLTGDGDRLADARFRVHASDGRQPFSSLERGTTAPEGAARFLLPAGSYRVIASVGQAMTEDELTLTPGEYHESELAIDAARVRLLLQPAQPAWFAVFRIEDGPDGMRRIRIFNDGFHPEQRLTLAEGNYIAFVRTADDLRGEHAFHVDAGVEQKLTIRIGH